MAGPARAGIFIYAANLARLADFYEAVLGAARLHSTPELVVLGSPDLQVVVHAMPPHPPSDRTDAARPEHAAYKFFYTVPGIEQARTVVTTLGGEILPGRWQGPGFTVCNVVDPEGNIFQLREPSS